MDLKKIMEKIAEEAINGMEVAIKNLYRKDKLNPQGLAESHHISEEITNKIISEVEKIGLDDDEAAVVISSVINLLSKTYAIYLNDNNISVDEEIDRDLYTNEERFVHSEAPDSMYL